MTLRASLRLSSARWRSRLALVFSCRARRALILRVHRGRLSRTLGLHGPQHLPRGTQDTNNEGRRDGGGCEHRRAMPTGELADPVDSGRRAGFDGVTVEKAVDVGRQGQVDSYRRLRSFSRHFITTQSSSPRRDSPRRWGSLRR